MNNNWFDKSTRKDYKIIIDPELGPIKRFRLKLGNLKLYKIFVFDLPAGKNGSCRQTCPQCYALKAERLYKNTAIWRRQNFILSQKYPEILSKLIETQLELFPEIKTIRIHSSGDFYSQEYLSMWYNIIEKFPDRRFYAYTKNYDYLDFNTNKPDNFNIIDSYIKIGDKKYINYGTPDYIHELKRKDPSIFICPATDKTIKDKVMCNRDCDYCTHSDRVVFYKH